VVRYSGGYCRLKVVDLVLIVERAEVVESGVDPLPAIERYKPLSCGRHDFWRAGRVRRLEKSVLSVDQKDSCISQSQPTQVRHADWLTLTSFHTAGIWAEMNGSS
jgi:hypothetical protein